MIKSVSTIEKEVNELIRQGKNIYLIRDPRIKKYLKTLIAKAKKENAGLKVYRYSKPMNVNIRCHTCGAVNQHHPITSYCFNCNTDNW